MSKGGSQAAGTLLPTLVVTCLRSKESRVKRDIKGKGKAVEDEDEQGTVKDESKFVHFFPLHSLTSRSRSEMKTL